MMNRTKKAFSLVELVVVIVITGILALVAFPSFNSLIGKFRTSTVEQTAEVIAREANALAGFNTGTDTYQTTKDNIVEAVEDTTMPTADGWSAPDDSFANGVEISLTKNGDTSTYCIAVVAGVDDAPDRAVATEGEC
jgi:prepilin-type N-terminal cleavage/methylation domain-containing protein